LLFLFYEGRNYVWGRGGHKETGKSIFMVKFRPLQIERASPIVKISNQLIEDFKKIYELRPILPVAALKIKALRKENYSYLIG